MNIGLIDVDNKLPNLSLMKISAYYKSLGANVEFAQQGKLYDKLYAAAIFTKSKEICNQLKNEYGERLEIGGTGYDLNKKLPAEIEKMKPDYDLWTLEKQLPNVMGAMSKQRKIEKALQIINAGLGTTSRGCPRNCGFCLVPKKEGQFRQDSEIKNIINPRSNILILNDNNFTADPFCLEKLQEIKARKLIVDLNQGIDIRLITEEKAYMLNQVSHLRSIHYAWDLMVYEKQVLRGIEILSKYVRPYRQMCYMLVGYDTTFEEDLYRVNKLHELNITPYIMIYNQNEKKSDKLRHFARFVYAKLYKKQDFKNYLPWIKEQLKDHAEAMSLFPNIC